MKIVTPHRATLNIEGQKYHRLTVISFHSGNPVKWNCRCECGKNKIVSPDNLKSGAVKSCGCLFQEFLDRITAERLARIKYKPTKSTWQNMKNRCKNPNVPAYQDYGARGIKVCERWMSFDNFLQDMGIKPNGLSIERIDNSKGYEPGNCKWATTYEQSNNKRNNVIVEISHEQKTCGQLSKESGVKYELIRQRIKRGWKGLDLLRPPLKNWRSKP